MAFDQIVVKGTESLLIEVLMRSATTGQPLTGLAVGAVTVQYFRDGASASVDLSAPAVLAALGTWETDAWKETTIPGLYQYGVPNACLVPGANGVTLVFTGTAAITAKYRIVLSGVNIQDAVRAGMTALPNAAADGTGGLPISDAGGLDLDLKLAIVPPSTTEIVTAILASPTYKLATDSSGRVTVGSNADKSGYTAAVSDKTGFSLSVAPPTTTEIKTAMQDTGTYLKALYDVKPAYPPDVASTGEVGIDLSNIKQAADATTLTNITVPTVTTLTNKTGFALSVTPPTTTEIAAVVLATPANKLATDGTGRVTVGSNADKDGYSLATTPPTTTEIKMAIEVDGGKLDALYDVRPAYTPVVTADGSVKVDKTGYALAVTPPTTGQIVTAIETNGTMMARLNALLETSGDHDRFKAAALEEAPPPDMSGVVIPPPEVDFTEILDAISDIPSVLGPGADHCTVLITVDGNPAPDADVWITSDESGSLVVAGTAQTNSSGHVAFMLDDGETYYLWAQKDGINSIMGREFVAEKDND